MTMPGMIVNQRDIVLVPFPFSDGNIKKKRPAVIISNKKYNQSSQDIICCAITKNPKLYSHCIPISNVDLDSGNLMFDSIIKPDKIFTLEKNKIIKTLGKLNYLKSKIIINNFNDCICLN